MRRCGPGRGKGSALRLDGRIAGGKCAAGQSRPTQGDRLARHTPPALLSRAAAARSCRAIRPPSFGVYAAVRHDTPITFSPSAVVVSITECRNTLCSTCSISTWAGTAPTQRRASLPNGIQAKLVAGSRCSAADRSPPDRDTSPRPCSLQDADQDRLSLRDRPICRVRRRRVDVTAGEIDDGAGAPHLEDRRPPVLVAVGGAGNEWTPRPDGGLDVDAAIPRWLRDLYPVRVSERTRHTQHSLVARALW